MRPHHKPRADGARHASEQPKNTGSARRLVIYKARYAAGTTRLACVCSVLPDDTGRPSGTLQTNRPLTASGAHRGLVGGISSPKARREARRPPVSFRLSQRCCEPPI